jgi:RNA polymerase sigma factor (sigma-70 family)
MTAIDRSLHGAEWGGDTLGQPLAPAPELVDDRALLDRLRSGEDSAFGELFARHAAAVRRLALGLVHDRSESEDLTAEAFFRVLQAIRRGAGPVDNVRGYLLIVARRVAWEWQTRHRDVPVSDEELTQRAGADPDTSGQSTERNLITRAFTSLPERWRSVLWKVEVEGERPAVVATNFGLSANATAALARRARQGLRAAYLQAHLAADRSSTGCRSVLEKLGAYTAGSIKGGERRRIRAHLGGCASCTSMHDELRDVCSGLRANAGLVAVPVLAVGGGGLASTVKGVLAGAKIQVALVASSATVVGMLGLVAGPWLTGGDATLADDLDGKRGVELEITGAQPTGQRSPETIALTTGTLSTAAVVSGKRRRTADAAAAGVPAGAPPDLAPATGGVSGANTGDARVYDTGSPVVYRATTVSEYSEAKDGYTVVYETTSVTEVNSAQQTTIYTNTRKYTSPAVAPGTADSGARRADPSSTGPPTSSDESSTPSVAVTTTTTPPTSSSGKHR